MTDNEHRELLFLTAQLRRHHERVRTIVHGYGVVDAEQFLKTTVREALFDLEAAIEKIYIDSSK